MAGTWSEWETGDFNSCTKSCGGGHVQNFRICRYPPCEGDAFQTTDEECNTQGPLMRLHKIGNLFA